MSQINVNTVLPLSGDIVTLNGIKAKATATTIQMNSNLSGIPSTNSVVIGSFAGQNLASGSNGSTLIGSSAGSSVTTGQDNVLIGKSAGSHITTGAGNVYVGSGTGGNVNPIGGNTYIGNSAGVGLAGANNTLIGSLSGNGIASTNQNITCIGNGAGPSTSSVYHEVTIGNSAITALRCAVTSITSLSDARDKKDVEDLNVGLNFIDGLRPVKFVWNDRDEAGKHDIADFGFIAQDLKSAEEEIEMADVLKLVYDENPEKLEASYGKLVPILVKAVQELSAEVKALKAK